MMMMMSMACFPFGHYDMSLLFFSFSLHLILQIHIPYPVVQNVRQMPILHSAFVDTKVFSDAERKTSFQSFSALIASVKALYSTIRSMSSSALTVEVAAMVLFWP